MSSTQQQAGQRQQQQQVSASVPGPTKALDNLQAMFNLFLIQVGQYLREQKAGGGTGRQKAKIKETIPPAADHFHKSLDELENEVRQAQAVIRRDLALQQAARKKREEAEAAERERLAAAASSAKLDVQPHPREMGTQAKAEVKTEDAVKMEDVSMSGVDEPNAQSADQQPPPVSTEAAGPPADDSSANTAQDTDFDFDAMFGDSFGDTATETKEASKEDANAEENMHFPDEQNQLLRGLEDFAKAEPETRTEQADPKPLDSKPLGLDFPMPDLPDLPPNSNPQDLKPNQTSTPADTTQDANAMATDEFNALFDMDYEPPESTEFDDAFFGWEGN
ncbi:hypothetical protein M011DRAFT_478215 [Sporormia fimetaria CBS 119925]|uniref:Uncharacterized protein n=1 Tax=Sporormia fimetaria CBS 119925 TaxID=1340428 RepID=A0A6A6VAP8_9PLEO|nr:hypothetical protein M011DRAFT_478215 [Sporormia fimetaria CBS 119925]